MRKTLFERLPAPLRRLAFGALQRVARAGHYELTRINSNPLDVFSLAVADLYQRSERPLTFFQAGAHDGKSRDPLYPLIHRYHLTGVRVEPQPRPYRLLARLHAHEPAVRCFNVAVGTAHGERPLYQGHDSMEASLCGPGARRILVPVWTVAEILARAGMDYPDIVQLDCEGYDWVIIQEVLGLCRPQIIHFEGASLGHHSTRRCQELLRCSGYRTLDNGIDTTAVQQWPVLDWHPEHRAFY